MAVISVHAEDCVTLILCQCLTLSLCRFVVVISVQAKALGAASFGADDPRSEWALREPHPDVSFALCCGTFSSPAVRKAICMRWVQSQRKESACGCELSQLVGVSLRTKGPRTISRGFPFKQILSSASLDSYISLTGNSTPQPG